MNDTNRPVTFETYDHILATLKGIDRNDDRVPVITLPNGDKISTPVFTGRYVEQIVHALIGALVSGVNIMLIGVPGYGKTTISRAFFKKVLRNESDRIAAFVRCDPTTPVEKIRGGYDPIAWSNGEVVHLIEGTPYDPRSIAAIVDEMPRANDAILDVFLDLFDLQEGQGLIDALTIVATANFAPRGDRFEALNDRITLWAWLKGGDDFDPDKMVDAHAFGLKPVLRQWVPTWDQIQAARQAVPSKNALVAVKSFVRRLVEAAAAQNIAIDPRDYAQWTPLLIRASILYTGDPDFREVPYEAATLIKHAGGATTRVKAEQWEAIVAEVVDTVGEALDQVLGGAFKHFDALLQINELERAEQIHTLGEFLTEQQGLLRELGGGKQIEDACNLLQRYFALAVQGIDPREHLKNDLKGRGL